MEFRCLEGHVALCGSAAGEGSDGDAACVSGEFGVCHGAFDCGGNLVQ